MKWGWCECSTGQSYVFGCVGNEQNKEQSHPLAQVHLTALGELVVQLLLGGVLGLQQFLHLHVNTRHHLVNTLVVELAPESGCGVFRALVYKVSVPLHVVAVGWPTADGNVVLCSQPWRKCALWC